MWPEHKDIALYTYISGMLIWTIACIGHFFTLSAGAPFRKGLAEAILFKGGIQSYIISIIILLVWGDPIWLPIFILGLILFGIGLALLKRV